MFLLQVKWKKSDVKFEDRFDKYLDPSFFQHRVRFLDICSCVTLEPGSQIFKFPSNYVISNSLWSWNFKLMNW